VRTTLIRYYSEYVWKNGKPYGIAPAEHPEQGITYKVVSDPYYKRISVEKYFDQNFLNVVYDSALFDFRSLKPAEQTAWQKSAQPGHSEKARCAIRDQDDRLVLIEEYGFDGIFCRECRSTTPHGILIAVQKMFYSSLKDLFDGVVLYDANSHPVIFKRYSIDPLTKDFSDLIEEEWDMTAARSHSFLKTIAPLDV
jgi:hypothetical protein